MSQSESDGLMFERRIQDLTNRVAELTEELAVQKQTNVLLRQANMAQSAEIQKLRSVAIVLP